MNLTDKNDYKLINFGNSNDNDYNDNDVYHELVDEPYDDSFLSKLKRNRRNYLQKLNELAEEGSKKFLSKSIYDDIKLLNSDVLAIMDNIENASHTRNSIIYNLKIDEFSTIGPIQKLYDIYIQLSKKYNISNNKILLNKYWRFVDSAIEIFVSCLIQKTGIDRREELPKINKNVYEPSNGIYYKNDNKERTLTIWW